MSSKKIKEPKLKKTTISFSSFYIIIKRTTADAAAPAMAQKTRKRSLYKVNKSKIVQFQNSIHKNQSLKFKILSLYHKNKILSTPFYIKIKKFVLSGWAKLVSIKTMQKPAKRLR